MICRTTLLNPNLFASTHDRLKQHLDIQTLEKHCFQIRGFQQSNNESTDTAQALAYPQAATHSNVRIEWEGGFQYRFAEQPRCREQSD